MSSVHPNEEDPVSDYGSMFGDSSDTDGGSMFGDSSDTDHDLVDQGEKVHVKNIDLHTSATHPISVGNGGENGAVLTTPYVHEESLSDQGMEKALFGSDDSSNEEDVEYEAPPRTDTGALHKMKSEPEEIPIPPIVSMIQASAGAHFVEQAVAEAPHFQSQNEVDEDEDSSHLPMMLQLQNHGMQQIKVESQPTTSFVSIQNAALKIKEEPATFSVPGVHQTKIKAVEDSSNQTTMGINSNAERIIHQNRSGMATTTAVAVAVTYPSARGTNIDPRQFPPPTNGTSLMSPTIPRKRKLPVKSEEIPTKNEVMVKQEDSIADKLISQYVSTQHLTFNEHLRPDQYPVIHFDQFWQTMRSWDFITELDVSSKAQSQSKIKSEPEQSQESDDESTTSNNEESKKKKPSTSLPDEFFCGEQYAALWAPLLLKETKAQIISELASSPIPPVKLSVPVLVTPMLKGDDRYGETLVLNIVLNHRQHDGALPARLNAKAHSTQEFLPNDLVLLSCSSSVIQEASRGALNLESSSDARSSSLISSVSPFIDSRLGVIGLVTRRSKHLGDGLVVQISRRLWKTKTATGPSDLTLLRIGHNSTSIREFRALCNVKETPLMKYLLGNRETFLDTCEENSNDLLSADGGSKALGAGFRIWVKSKFNDSQKAAINAAAREYGSGGFTLVKGPPGTGKTTTLVALLNALHLRQYQKYYSEIERISKNPKAGILSAINAAAKVKPRILVCTPSNTAVDNVIMKIIEERFVDGNGGRYNPSIVRIGLGHSPSVANVSLKKKMDQILSETMNPEKLDDLIESTRLELKRLQKEIENLQRRVRLMANASSYDLSEDWEIRIDEENFEKRKRLLFINHKLQKVSITRPGRPKPGERVKAVDEMPHYRGCMANLVKQIERHNDTYSKLEQFTLIKNSTSSQSKHNQVKSELSQQLETHIIDSTHIVMTTLGSAGSKSLESVAKFEVVVVDEAAQSSEPSILPALQLGSSHAVLVGDPQQLPATIFSVSGRLTKYDRSLFQRLEEAGHPVNMLNVQYRMHPRISSFPRRIFYDGSLLDGPQVKEPTFGGVLKAMVGTKFPQLQPLTVFDLNSAEEREGTSLSNSTEAHLVMHLFKSLDKETNGLTTKSRVAIITPYSQQAGLLRRIFEEEYGAVYNTMVDISTIDAFQGKEASIVMLSCVRGSNKTTGIGFLSDVQRMNVALTRAKHFLFVVARCRTITVNPYWRDLVKFAREQKAVLQVVPKSVRRNIQNTTRKNGAGRNKAPSITFPDLRSIISPLPKPKSAPRAQLKKTNNNGKKRPFSTTVARFPQQNRNQRRNFPPKRR